ncbi:uncharacterized protein LOC144406174 [Gasterosteus aculeatus]
MIRLMGFLQNQNLTQPEVTRWESTPHRSAAVNNIIIVLGVLTFTLQLCLALFFMLKCWRFDNRVQEALKHSETGNKLTDTSCLHTDRYKQARYLLCTDADAAASSPARFAAAGECEPITDSLLTPPIPWDLVQR